MDLPLRIHPHYYSGQLFADPAPDGWMLGNCDYLDIHTPLRLLRDGAIDAWIGCYPDVLDGDDPDLTSFPLTRLPVHLVIGDNHPLLELGDQITLEMVKQYPCLALPDGAYPKVNDVVQKMGLWMLSQEIVSFSQWQSAVLTQIDRVVCCATAFTISLFPNSKVILPKEIPLEVGDSLVVRRDYATHPRLLELLEKLRTRAAELAQQYPEVRIPAS